MFTPGLAGLVLGEYRRLRRRAARARRPDTPRLTERETEVLRLVAKGLSYKQIAERLVLSHRTVQNHVQNTLGKLQLHNRVRAGPLRHRAGTRRRDRALMTDLPVLDAVEQRVLGSLLEKQRTVPASYPLSLNALRTACNQSSSRDPVVDYDEQTVERTARALKDRGLLRIVWADTGRRTLKYHQTLEEVLGLADDERALLTVLLLRGPQAPGELRTRTERLHAFADRTEVEAVLARMAERATPWCASWSGGPDSRTPVGAPARRGARRAGRAGAGRRPRGRAARRRGGAHERVRPPFDAVAEPYAAAPGRRARRPALRALAAGPGRRRTPARGRSSRWAAGPGT